MTRSLARPRNLDSLARLEPGAAFVISLLGPTTLREPHVYIDHGKRYDWGFARDLFVLLVVDRSKKLEPNLTRDLFRYTAPYPTLIDPARKVVASIVEGPGETLRLWPRRAGGDPWKALFAS